MLTACTNLEEVISKGPPSGARRDEFWKAEIISECLFIVGNCQSETQVCGSLFFAKDDC